MKTCAMLSQDDSTDKVFGRISKMKKSSSRVLRGKKAGVVLNSKGKIRFKTREVDRDLTKINVELTKEEKRVKKLFRYLIKHLPSTKERNCVRAIDEIYHSEQKYATSLQTLIRAKDFMKKLQYRLSCSEESGSQKKCRHGISKKSCDGMSLERRKAFDNKDIDIVFLNIKSLEQVHAKTVVSLTEAFNIFYKRLCNGEALSVKNLIDVICDVFSLMAPYWMMYTVFVQRFELSMKTLANYRTKDEAYKKFEGEINDICGMSLMYLLNVPMQRVTKYPLLFHTLGKHVRGLVNAITNNEEQIMILNELLKKIDAVTSIIKSIVEKVNVKMGVAGEMDRMCKLYAMFGTRLKTTDFLQPWRRLMFEYTLIRVDYGAEIVDNECKMYLLTDMLIVTSNLREDVGYRNNLAPFLRKVSKTSPSTSSFSLNRVKRNTSIGNNSESTLNSFGSRMTRLSSIASHFSRRSTRSKVETRPNVPVVEVFYKDLTCPRIALDRSEGFPMYLLTYEDTETDEILILFFLKTEERSKVMDFIDHQRKLRA